MNNCFQGFKIQLEWQKTTGRSMIENSTNISLNSWFGSMNYYQSVIPYLSAMNLGIVPELEIINIGDNRFCTTYSECDISLMETWDLFFQYLMKIKDEKYSYEYQQQLLIYNWDGHSKSIDIGMKIFNDKLKTLTKNEAHFSTGFGHFVEIIALINFNTNYTQILPIFDSLPPRMLTNYDCPPFFRGFTNTQNIYTTSVLSINDMYQNQFEWNLFINLLKSKTKNDQCRDLINREIINFTKYPESTLIKLLFKLLINDCS
ncbi:hypothetical protein RB653_005145 [Dictyostelium firmibasis]|uniref:Uncharacterized protein n=1 Tax=Dictyostelium firmibasis TaxID=79012 RepID=A0AAN7UKJ5_9MYCE